MKENPGKRDVYFEICVFATNLNLVFIQSLRESNLVKR